MAISTRLTKAIDTRRRARRKYEDATAELYAAITAEVAAGGYGTAAEVARATGYTRERIRQLTRADLDRKPA
jgi:hypothetical protein